MPRAPDGGRWKDETVTNPGGTAEQRLAELQAKLSEWRTNISDHHALYLAERDSISAMGSRAQLQLLDAIDEVLAQPVV